MGRAHGVPLCTSVAGSASAPWVRRVLSATLLLPPFAAVVVWGPPWVWDLLVLGVSALAQWEFTRMFRRGGVGAFPVLGLCGGLAVSASFLIPDGVPVALTLVVLAVLAAGITARESIAWEPAAVTLVGVCYVNLLLGHAVWLRGLHEGVAWVLFLVTVTWVGETAAYAVGSALGRHKLAPRVSPGKTVEGAVAQLTASAVAAVIAHALLLPGRPAWQGAGLGLLLGVVAQVGDLVESLLKRSIGAKDSGEIIPGHGGILDRVDGLLFCTPVLFYCVAPGRPFAG
jgi:phosphatidate cytidylyltransferase